jgi:Zn-dependent protease
MFGKTIKIAKLFGIDILVDFSWLIIFVLVTFSFGNTFLLFFPQINFPLVFLYAVVSALIFFTSVLLHELGHSVLAKRYGITVPSITLFIFGGIASIQEEPKKPKDEFMIALAGPLISLALGIGFIALAFLNLPTIYLLIFQLLGSINLMLAFFNLLPGFPLDGGRILRSLIWTKTGDFKKATYYAARSGQIIAGFVIAGGIIQLFFTGSFGSIWLIIVGYFLFRLAKISILELKY